MTTFILGTEDKKQQRLIEFLGAQYFPNVTSALHSAANYVQKTWVDKVKNSNARKGWKEHYINAITIDSTKPLTIEIFAKNKFANFIENGVKRFDMKPGLLSGKNAQKHGGKFAIVFFRKGVPGAEHIPTMPNVIYTKIKQIPYKASLKNVGTLGMTEAEINKAKQRKYKSGLYEGLTKLGQTGHTQMGTFRVVSKKSLGWIYPGVPKVEIYPRVAEIIPNRVKEIINEGLQLDIKSGLEYLNK